MNKSKLRSLALKVRSLVVERIQQAHRDERREYTAYGYVHNLEGACGYASWALWKALPGSTLVLGDWGGSTHSWVEWQGHIIDITATQFELAKVRVVLRAGRAGKNYTMESRNEKAEEDIHDWYPIGWEAELTALMEERGLTRRRAA